VVWVVLVLAGLFLLLSSFAVWVDRVALNTDVFVDTSSELLEDDEIRAAVATRAVDELFASVDVQAELEGRLPEDYQGLSGPAAAGLQQASYEIVDRALQQQVFQRLWALTVAESHGTLLTVLEGGSEAISTEGGVVTLDLRLLIVETADRIGLGQDLVDRIPDDAGVIEVLRADELDTAQNGFQLLETLAWVLPILTLLAFVGVAWLAGDRRRAVRRIGATLLAVGVLGLVAVALVGNYIVESLVSETENEAAAANAWDILTTLLRSSFRTMIPVGILFVAASWLAGSGRRAVAVRGAMAPLLRERIWAYVALAAVALLLLLTSTVTDFSRLLVVLVLVALGATWIEVMRRQTLREVPAGSSTVLDDWRERLSGWWEERRRARAEAARPVAPVAPAPTDLSARLTALADLHGRGALTDEEYAAAKARVLAGD
jgi:hypothetical protein